MGTDAFFLFTARIKKEVGADSCSHLSVPCRGLLLKAVLLVELIDAALCGSCSLLTRVERMALRAYLDVDFLLCRACHECVAAVACYCALLILRMNSFLHYNVPPGCSAARE